MSIDSMLDHFIYQTLLQNAHVLLLLISDYKTPVHRYARRATSISFTKPSCECPLVLQRHRDLANQIEE